MIKLRDGWQIVTDEKNYVLQQELIAKEGKYKGETYLSVPSYYSSLKQALKALMQYYQMQSIMDGEITLSEAFKRLSAVHDEFEPLLHEIEEIEKV